MASMVSLLHVIVPRPDPCSLFVDAVFDSVQVSEDMTDESSASSSDETSEGEYIDDDSSSEDSVRGAPNNRRVRQRLDMEVVHIADSDDGADHSRHFLNGRQQPAGGPDTPTFPPRAQHISVRGADCVSQKKLLAISLLRLFWESKMISFVI